MTVLKHDIDLKDPATQPLSLSHLLAPYLFVVLWSTGFVGARYGLPHAEPFTLLCIRFSVTLAVLAVAIVLSGAPWPTSRRQTAHICIVGILTNVGYLGSNFLAMSKSMPLAIVALVGGLQPLLTAILAGPILGEKVNLRAWAGLILGLGGVILVLLPKIGTIGFTPVGIISVVVGLFAMTGGTVYQKKYCPHAPLQTGMAIQLTAALAVIAPLAFLFETRVVTLTPTFVLTVLWLSVVLSLGAMTVFWLLVRRGEANKVASVFYLTPATTAVFAYVLFGEKLSALAIAGMLIAASGVALVTLPSRANLKIKNDTI